MTTFGATAASLDTGAGGRGRERSHRRTDWTLSGGNVLYLYGDVDSVGKYTSANSANRVLKSMPPTVPKNYTSV